MKACILDTNVLLHDPRAIYQFAKAEVVIPIEVIEEVEHFKRDTGELGRSSRTVAALLDDLRKVGRLGEGVELENGGRIRVICEHPQSHRSGSHHQSLVDKSILAIAADLKNSGHDVLVVTKNVNLRLKADVLGIPAEDYEMGRYVGADRVTGWRRAVLPLAALDALQSGRQVKIAGIGGHRNEFIYAVGDELAETGIYAAVTRETDVLRPLKRLPKMITGIQPLSIEQGFALAALMDDDIKLVTLTGKAGTGKTLLALAAGFHKVYAEDVFGRVLVFRPTMPVSRDMGFLPGDLRDKMGPWMQPVYDAIDLLKALDKNSDRRILPQDLLESGDLSVEPLTYIRGRSIPNQFIIIDEAQNLTPLEVKTVITRVGRGSKIVLTGDPHQIDNPYVDALSNGLSCLVDKFRGNPLYAHVGLVKGERSEIAEMAANLL